MDRLKLMESFVTVVEAGSFVAASKKLGTSRSLLSKHIGQLETALGMHILIYDPYLSESRSREMGAELGSFDALLARSDFISLHMPLNDQTHHLFGEATFAKMKSAACIINTARGGLIDEAALLAALDSGRIFGAGLDVMESETSFTSTGRALVNHPKVIVTPHTAWLSDEARKTLQARAVEQVIACLKGETPYGLVNRSLVK